MNNLHKQAGFIDVGLHFFLTLSLIAFYFLYTQKQTYLIDLLFFRFLARR